MNVQALACEYNKQLYYAEMPNGQVVPINWVQYEQLKAFGWVHRIMTETQAVLHSLKYLKRKA